MEEAKGELKELQSSVSALVTGLKDALLANTKSDVSKLGAPVLYAPDTSAETNKLKAELLERQRALQDHREAMQLKSEHQELEAQARIRQEAAQQDRLHFQLQEASMENDARRRQQALELQQANFRAQQEINAQRAQLKLQQDEASALQSRMTADRSKLLSEMRTSE